MNLSIGGFWGKEMVDAGCTAYSSCKHFLVSSLAGIKGLRLIRCSSPRHRLGTPGARSVSVRCLAGQCSALVLRKLTLQRKELNQLRQTHRVLGREVSTSASRLQWAVLPGTSSQDLRHSTPKSLRLRPWRPGGEEHSVPLIT